MPYRPLEEDPPVLQVSDDFPALAQALQELVFGKSKFAPSRVFARAGINYFFAKTLVENDLIKSEKTGKRHTKVSITEKGRTFLTHYRVCDALLPS